MGPDRGKHLRNIAIILLLAVIVWQVPAGAAAGATIANVISIIFVGGLLFFGYRLYMEHRATIFGLEDRQRAILYGAVAVGALAIIATSKLWAQGGLGALLWFAMLAVAVWGLYSVWRAYQEY